MVDLTQADQIASIFTAVATIALVVIIWKTVSQLEESVKLSRLQSTYRFRPWVGPSGKIEYIGKADEKDQFSITLRNYGELPALNLTASFFSKSEPITRDATKSAKKESLKLGPLLPNMEKRYWFFIDSSSIERSRTGQQETFVFLYFGYEHPNGQSGYGMISQFDSKLNSFIHREMWTD